MIWVPWDWETKWRKWTFTRSYNQTLSYSSSTPHSIIISVFVMYSYNSSDECFFIPGFFIICNIKCCIFTSLYLLRNYGFLFLLLHRYIILTKMFECTALVILPYWHTSLIIVTFYAIDHKLSLMVIVSFYVIYHKPVSILSKIRNLISLYFYTPWIITINFCLWYN